MEKITANNTESFRPFYPGELIKDELEYRKIRQKDFAERCGFSYTALNEILNGKRPLSIEFALLIEAALDINADMLVRMQTEYNLQVARKNNKIKNRLDKIRKIAAML